MTDKMPNIFPLQDYEVLRRYDTGDKPIASILLDGEVIEMDMTRAAYDVLQDIQHMRFKESASE